MQISTFKSMPICEFRRYFLSSRHVNKLRVREQGWLRHTGEQRRSYFSCKLTPLSPSLSQNMNCELFIPFNSEFITGVDAAMSGSWSNLTSAPSHFPFPNTPDNHGEQDLRSGQLNEINTTKNVTWYQRNVFDKQEDNIS